MGGEIGAKDGFPQGCFGPVHSCRFPAGWTGRPEDQGTQGAEMGYYGMSRQYEPEVYLRASPDFLQEAVKSCIPKYGSGQGEKDRADDTFARYGQ